MPENKEVKLNENLDLIKDFPPGSIKEWKENVEKDLKGQSFEKKLHTKTYEGIELKPIYTKDDVDDLTQTNNFPGFDHFMRGEDAAGYNLNPWTISQEIPYSLAEELNDALQNDLNKGQTGINVVPDHPTMLGIDADYAKEGEVGKEGVSISALKSITKIFNGIDLTKFPVTINSGFSSLPLFILFSSFLKKNNFKMKDVNGGLLSDPLSYLLKFGSLPYSVNNILDEIKIVTESVIKSGSEMRTISANGIPYNNTGANAVQELAFTLSSGIYYMNEMIERGLTAEEVQKRIQLSFGVGSFYFMEVAKLRAARILWNNILNAYGVEENKREIFIHARTSSYNQTTYDPHVNLLRTTTEAFSAIVGGANSITTNAFDEQLNLPKKFSRRVARNTQIILNEESHLSQVIDPAGGSFYVEKLTEEVAQTAWKMIGEIDKQGDILESLKNGYLQNKIKQTVDLREKDYKKRKAVLVGTNMYANPKEEKPVKDEADYKSVYKKRVDYLQKFRTSGKRENDDLVLKNLQSLTDAKSGDLIENGIEAFLNGATIGEVSKSIRSSYSGGDEIEKLIFKRAAEPFEEIRNAAFNFFEKNGSKPRIFLANMGSVKDYKARADFSRGFFETGGFEVIYPKGVDDNESVLEVIKTESPDGIVICSTDEKYVEIVPELATKIKKEFPETKLILAGRPVDKVEEYKKAGIDEFIFLGADVYDVLTSVLKSIDVSI